MTLITGRQKLLYFFPVFFAFCLPFGSLLLSGIIIAWTLVAATAIQKDQLMAGLRKPLLWLCVSFFLVTALSAVFSEHVADSLFAVEIAMGFILFPFLLLCFRYPADILKRCVISFVSGCFFASLYLVARAFLYYLQGHPEYFFYTQFSWFIHAGYFAMYLVLAIVFVILLYDEWFRTQKTVIYSSWFFVCFFIAGIFLCASKLGLISMCVCVPVALFYKYRRSVGPRGILAILSVFVVVIWLATVLFPATFSRLRSLGQVSAETIDRSSTESTAVRLLIWREAFAIARENIVAGTGAGDANQALYGAYRRHGLTGAYERRLNAHNQFLQTFLGMGLAGFIPLVLLTVGMLVVALRRRHLLLVIFLLLITMNFMVESMLQASAGVLFFLFFLCFFETTGLRSLLSPATRTMP